MVFRCRTDIVVKTSYFLLNGSCQIRGVEPVEEMSRLYDPELYIMPCSGSFVHLTRGSRGLDILRDLLPDETNIAYG